jgi:hypothetical protein
VADRVALGQVCGRQWHWDRFVVDSGTGTGMWRTEWRWERFVVERVALGQVCGRQRHWDRFVADRVALGQVCGRQWRWDRFVVDRVTLGQVSLPVLRVSPVSIILPTFHAHILST